MLTLMLTTLVALADTTCPPAVAEALSAVDAAKTERAEVRETLLSTDWAFRLATEDRDAVRAEQDRLRSELKDVRAEVRDARRGVSDLKSRYSKEELSCEPSASLDPASDTVRS